MTGELNMNRSCYTARPFGGAFTQKFSGIFSPVSWLSGIPILMYHEVAERDEVDELARWTQRGYILVREDFDRQMAFLAAEGFQSVSLNDLYNWSQGQASLPPKPVVITFDDGFAGNYRHAFPILQRHGFGAAFFVVTNRIDEPFMMRWSELSEMHRQGMEIESHTANHPLLSTLTKERTRDEFVGSKRMLEDKLGGATRFLSLPNGDSNPFYVPVVKAAGYLGGCGSQFGFNTPSTDHFFWRRIAVKHEIGFDGFRDLLLRRRSTMLYHAAKAAAKTAVARTLGKKTYDRLYNLVFGVQEQDKSKQQ